MSRTTYRLTKTTGETFESLDQEEARGWKLSEGGTLEAFDTTFRVTNDPNVEIIDDYETAEARVVELQQLYQLETIHTLISPQPDGLND